MISSLFVGVDPGKDGGIAVLDEAGQVLRLEAIPLVGNEYDLVAIRVLLNRIAQGTIPRLTVEKSQPMPPSVPGGSLANFQRGVSRGWEWMAVALCLPYELVAPRTWQAAMFAGLPEMETKARSVLACQRLFPGVSLLRTAKCSKAHDGMADALLLAEWGRRKHRAVAAAERVAVPA